MPKPAASRLSPRARYVAIGAGALVLVLAAVYLARRRSQAAATAPLNTSGTPGPDLSGSAAQQPAGGASSVPGNLPPLFVSQPDPLTWQVQAADASSDETPAASASSSPASSSPYTPVYTSPDTGSTWYQVAGAGSEVTTHPGRADNSGGPAAALPLPTVAPAPPAAPAYTTHQLTSVL